MSNSENLHLLVIEESRGDAESLANELRNAGHTISLRHVTGLVPLEAALAEQVPDILICGSGGDLPDAAGVRQLLDRQQIESPVIAIADEAPEEKVVTARKAGIAALVSYERPDHLHAVFRHEAETVRLRTRLKAFTGKLRASEKRCHALIENSSDAIAYVHDGMHVYANRPYMNLFDITSREEIEGMPVLDMISSSQQDTFREFLKNFNDDGNANNTLEIDCVSPGGELFSSTMELSPATMDGEACIQIVIRVRSGDNSELEQKIKTLSRQDMLTGLCNRQYFMRLLDERIGSGGCNDRQHALVYLTLDNFKVIREEAGIAASDLVLCDIASLLRGECGEHDLLSRFGDCSFALLKQGDDMESLQAAGEKLLNDIAGHLTRIDGRAFTMTASIGICEISRHTTDAQKIISHADMACEVARTSGGNRIHTHSTVVDESIGNDLDHDADRIIRETIDNERFYLVYQPIVSLKGNRSRHYEVLLRIVDADDHVILPGEFLSIAERAGLAPEIDRWVIDKAFAELAGNREEDDITFFIKVTGATLCDPESVAWINDRLQKYGLDSTGIVFEIAEQCAVSHLDQAIEFATGMRSAGCRIALEHFGLSDQVQLLKHLTVDIIKIDGSLVEGISGKQDCQSGIRAITESAREHKVLCIAERVDNANALAVLWQYNVDFIQGYFVQEPARELGYEFDSEIV